MEAMPPFANGPSSWMMEHQQLHAGENKGELSSLEDLLQGFETDGFECLDVANGMDTTGLGTAGLSPADGFEGAAQGPYSQVNKQNFSAFAYAAPPASHGFQMPAQGVQHSRPAALPGANQGNINVVLPRPHLDVLRSAPGDMLPEGLDQYRDREESDFYSDLASSYAGGSVQGGTAFTPGGSLRGGEGSVRSGHLFPASQSAAEDSKAQKELGRLRLAPGFQNEASRSGPDGSAQHGVPTSPNGLHGHTRLHRVVSAGNAEAKSPGGSVRRSSRAAAASAAIDEEGSVGRRGAGKSMRGGTAAIAAVNAAASAGAAPDGAGSSPALRASAGARGGVVKPHHPAVEKARRDRLNGLINEIRDLVPCSSEFLGANGTDKRPKHVVLQDAISALRDLISAASAGGAASGGSLLASNGGHRISGAQPLSSGDGCDTQGNGLGQSGSQ
ncbi:unnamed protein product [Pedinophyceae sp. YPF-701]|nr:unnamed protein product [Pedinophyceae sp. YPF-701]